MGMEQVQQVDSSPTGFASHMHAPATETDGQLPTCSSCQQAQQESCSELHHSCCVYPARRTVWRDGSTRADS
jgi:hypothetical protein